MLAAIITLTPNLSVVQHTRGLYALIECSRAGIPMVGRAALHAVIQSSLEPMSREGDWRRCYFQTEQQKEVLAPEVIPKTSTPILWRGVRLVVLPRCPSQMWAREMSPLLDSCLPLTPWWEGSVDFCVPYGVLVCLKSALRVNFKDKWNSLLHVSWLTPNPVICSQRTALRHGFPPSCDTASQPGSLSGSGFELALKYWMAHRLYKIPVCFAQLTSFMGEKNLKSIMQSVCV